MSEKLVGAGPAPWNGSSTASTKLDVLYVVLLVCLWGFFGIIYNIYSKKVLIEIPLPMTLGLMQLAICAGLVTLTWAFSPPPISVGLSSMKKYIFIAICHSFGMLGTLVSMNYSSVGFTHIVKAGEPIATAAFSFLLLSKRSSAATYATLALIFFGIALSSANDMTFSWIGFLSSSLATIFYPLRIVLSKQAVAGSGGISPRTLYRTISLLSAVIAIPLLVLDFVPTGLSSSSGLLSKMYDSNDILFSIVVSGASFHIYTEVMFEILNCLQPLSLAVLNSSRRVAIIYASSIAFGTDMSTMGFFGCTIAIAGAFLFSLSSIYNEK